MLSFLYMFSFLRDIFKKRAVYLDFASLTPIDKGVLKVMEKYSDEYYGNPSSIYSLGQNSKKVIIESKKKIANLIKAHSDEIYFTSSGTESNNIAIVGTFLKLKDIGGISGKNIVISSIEHSSVIETALSLKVHGVEVRLIKVDENGIVDLKQIEKSIDQNTILVSIMAVNNEIGSIEPINEIAKVIRHKRKEYAHVYPYFHTDACQAIYTDINVIKLGIDMMTLDSHKLYGPRGIGMLYKRRGVNIKPIIHGGNQEGGLRSGTENIPGIAGFTYAMQKAFENKIRDTQHISELKQYFSKGLKNINKDIVFNVDTDKSSPHILSINIPNIDNEMFLLRLDAKGISVSTKSACLRDENESYVLKAIGVNNSKNVIRFSLGNNTKKSDLDYVLNVMSSILKKF